MLTMLQMVALEAVHRLMIKLMFEKTVPAKPLSVCKRLACSSLTIWSVRLWHLKCKRHMLANDC